MTFFAVECIRCFVWCHYPYSLPLLLWIARVLHLYSTTSRWTRVSSTGTKCESDAIVTRRVKKSSLPWAFYLQTGIKSPTECLDITKFVSLAQFMHACFCLSSFSFLRSTKQLNTPSWLAITVVDEAARMGHYFSGLIAEGFFSSPAFHTWTWNFRRATVGISAIKRDYHSSPVTFLIPIRMQTSK